MPDFFKPKKQVLKTPEQAYSELLGSSTENQIVEIDVNLIDEIDNQPQKIHEDKIHRIVESMKIVGQLDPVIVISNPKIPQRYLLIAGRHRRRACMQLGLQTVKAVIKKETNPDKQRLMLLATNNDRNTEYLPSELAFSYLEQMELLQKLGSKSTASKVAQENNTNRKTVHKYIQLTNLIPPLLSRVDRNAITVGAGYELSFLSTEHQTNVINFILNHSDCHITKENARMIREKPNDIESVFFPVISNEEITKKSDNSESPKAEKKINYNFHSKDKCPSEGQKTNITDESLMTIAFILYRETYSIYRYIVNQFANSEESIDFIINRYADNGISYSDSLTQNDIPFDEFINNKYSIEFTSNKLSVVFNSNTQGKRKYKISYKDVDMIVRKYLRKYVSAEDKILAIKNQ